MNYQKEQIDFCLKGFKRIKDTFEANGTHSHVLKNIGENFFGRKPEFKFHRWAGSLKSSQALAFNIFSGIKDAEFEYDMWALDANPLHKACIDVAVKEKDVIKMFEVKMFEITQIGKNKIFNKPEQQKYFSAANYIWDKQVAESFISFIQNVKDSFKDQYVYGEGIKQLCCHVLGILNEMTIHDGKLHKKEVELISLCYDVPFTPKFEKHMICYKEALIQFKNLLDQYLQEINMDTKVKFTGFLSVKEFVNDNVILLGEENFQYVTERYLKNETIRNEHSITDIKTH